MVNLSYIIVSVCDLLFDGGAVLGKAVVGVANIGHFISVDS